LKLLIVDDHVLFREGLASILRSEPDIEVVGLAGTQQEAIDMASEKKPDIILMDYNLPDGSGAEATRIILFENPNCKVIVLTMAETDETLFASIRSGAKGYLIKSMTPSKLVATMRAVLRGEAGLSRKMTLTLMMEFAQTKTPDQTGDFEFSSLTPRERDVLVHIATGKSNKEIAQLLFLSENTIKYHIHSILDKTGSCDRKAAARFAKEHGVGS
jgi:two-component system nitrate/nitrite response regulator NarL